MKLRVERRDTLPADDPVLMRYHDDGLRAAIGQAIREAYVEWPTVRIGPIQRQVQPNSFGGEPIRVSWVMLEFARTVLDAQ